MKRLNPLHCFLGGAGKLTFSGILPFQKALLPALVVLFLAATPRVSAQGPIESAKHAELSEVPGSALMACTLTNVGDKCYAVSGSTDIYVTNANGLCVNVYAEPSGPCAAGDCSVQPCFCSATVTLPSGVKCGTIQNPVDCSTDWIGPCCEEVANGGVIHVEADICASKRIVLEAVACPCQ